MKNERRILAAIALAGDGVERGADGVPVAFRIWRAGSNPTDKGDSVFTKTSAEALIEEQDRRGNLYSIDFDHASLSMSSPPEARRAAGWFRIEVREGDLWATNVEWTDVARAGLAKTPPEFRYFSPAYDVSTKTGEIVSLLNMALTNNPATWSVTALASRAGSQGEAAMADDEKKPETSEADAMLAAFKKMGKLAALAAMKAAFPDDPSEKKDDDGKDDKKASEGDEKKPADEDEKKEAKAATKAVAATSTAPSTDSKLLDRIVQLEAEADKRKTDDAKREREQLFASRPDISTETKKLLENESPDRVKQLFATIPQRNRPNMVVETTPTRGNTQGDTSGIQATRNSEHADGLDQSVLGKRVSRGPNGWDGDKFQCRTRTPTESRAHLKTIEAARTAQNGVK